MIRSLPLSKFFLHLAKIRKSLRIWVILKH